MFTRFFETDTGDAAKTNLMTIGNATQLRRAQGIPRPLHQRSGPGQCDRYAAATANPDGCGLPPPPALV